MGNPDSHPVLLFLGEVKDTGHDLQDSLAVLASLGIPVKQDVLHQGSVDDILLAGLEAVNGLVKGPPEVDIVPPVFLHLSFQLLHVLHDVRDGPVRRQLHLPHPRLVRLDRRLHRRRMRRGQRHLPVPNLLLHHPRLRLPLGLERLQGPLQVGAPRRGPLGVGPRDVEIGEGGLEAPLEVEGGGAGRVALGGGAGSIGGGGVGGGLDLGALAVALLLEHLELHLKSEHLSLSLRKSCDLLLHLGPLRLEPFHRPLQLLVLVVQLVQLVLSLVHVLLPLLHRLPHVANDSLQLLDLRLLLVQHRHQVRQFLLGPLRRPPSPLDLAVRLGLCHLEFLPQARLDVLGPGGGLVQETSKLILNLT
mmetsp:Transcript_13221/g.27307  ORF Transcript_13221/g.27307 Transcript_13221/m.27307 type:complete len:361 (+) Transcript_13221:313-1395(+)